MWSTLGRWPCGWLLAVFWRTNTFASADIDLSKFGNFPFSLGLLGKETGQAGSETGQVGSSCASHKNRTSRFANMADRFCRCRVWPCCGFCITAAFSTVLVCVLCRCCLSSLLSHLVTDWHVWFHFGLWERLGLLGHWPYSQEENFEFGSYSPTFWSSVRSFSS